MFPIDWKVRKFSILCLKMPSLLRVRMHPKRAHLAPLDGVRRVRVKRCTSEWDLNP